jgi:hypothetical protein
MAALAACGGVLQVQSPDGSGEIDQDGGAAPCGQPGGAACPAPCSSLDEASCKARSDCRADTCQGCNGSGRFFSGCSDAAGRPFTGCILLCPALPCMQLATKEACEDRDDCHPVFVDGRDCDCLALGCCARFSYCADHSVALCEAPPIVCDAVTPYCEGPYVVGYTNGCYEGCVQSSDCGMN